MLEELENETYEDMHWHLRRALERPLLDRLWAGQFLQNISRQILILHNVRQQLPHIIRVAGGFW